MKSLKIGNLKIKNPLILAPMLDITNLPYRLLCRKAGCGLAYTEMLYASAILHENKKTKSMMLTSKADKPLGIQITGNNEKEFIKLVPYVKNYDLIDINCGCPSEKLIGSEAGSFLLNNPDKIKRMIKILRQSGKPVTAKIRLGHKNNNVMKIAKSIEKAGADALTIHSRLAIQGYNIPADWQWIKKAKNQLSIPVIGNGDIKDGKSAQEMLDIADGAMIARASIGNPLIFSSILHYLRTGKELSITFKDNINQFQKYIILSEKYNLANLSKIKHLGCHFIKGIPNSSKLRNQLMQLNSINEIKRFIKNI